MLLFKLYSHTELLRSLVSFLWIIMNNVQKSCVKHILGWIRIFVWIINYFLLKGEISIIKICIMHSQLEFLVSSEQPTGLNESWICLDYIIHFLAPHETQSRLKTRVLRLMVIDFVRSENWLTLLKSHARTMHIFQTGNKLFFSHPLSVCWEASDLCRCTVYTCTVSASPWSSLQSSRLSPSRQPVPGRRMSICNQLEIHI